MQMKIGIGIGDIGGAPADVDGIIAQAKRAEADGFASGWLANIFGFDAIMLAALCARETHPYRARHAQSCRPSRGTRRRWRSRR